MGNVYKDPQTNHKLKIMAPPLALGQAVHEVLDALSILPTEKRFQESLVLMLDKVWPKVTGKKGGFLDVDTEYLYKSRGQDMLRMVMANPGPLSKKAVKIKQDLPHYWLSEDENIILCGKIDWLEYLEDIDSVHIIDFKTGTKDEDPNSLQLPIYHLLAKNCQTRPVVGASYWYLERGSKLEDKVLPDIDECLATVLPIAREIKLARQLKKFECPHGSCHACTPFERVLKGEGEFVGLDEYSNDIYILPGNNISLDSLESEIL